MQVRFLHEVRDLILGQELTKMLQQELDIQDVTIAVFRVSRNGVASGLP